MSEALKIARARKRNRLKVIKEAVKQTKKRK